MLGQPLDELLSDHDLVDCLAEEPGKRDMDALSRVEVDEAVDLGRDERGLAAVLHPDCLLDACYAGARQADPDPGRRGLEVECGRRSVAHAANVAPLTDDSFARLVALVCHVLRTPLATVHGFAKTLRRVELADPAPRYVEMIEAASTQLGELLEQLALVTRIEEGRYEPNLREVDSLELVRAAAAEVEEESSVEGAGASVRVDEEPTRRALGRATRRHGGLESVSVARMARSSRSGRSRAIRLPSSSGRAWSSRLSQQSG